MPMGPSYGPAVMTPATTQFSVLVQAPAPPEPIPLNGQSAVSPSDLPATGGPPAVPYYPDTRQVGPMYPQTQAATQPAGPVPGCYSGATGYGGKGSDSTRMASRPGEATRIPPASPAKERIRTRVVTPLPATTLMEWIRRAVLHLPFTLRPLWFAGVYGMYMMRNNENHYMFSYDDAWESIQLTDSRDANPDLIGGFEVRFGRFFNCGQNAIEAIYWGVIPSDGDAPYPEDGITIVRAGSARGNLDGILNWDDLNYNGRTAEWWVNHGVAHAVFRESEFHNIEINWLYFCGQGISMAGGGCTPCGAANACCPPDPCGCSDPCGWDRFRFAWLFGVRYFKFRDELMFGADTVDGVFTGAPEEIYYDIETDNNLTGVQLGGLGRYYLTPRLAFDFGHKVGLFGNHIEHQSTIGGAAGLAMINNGPNYGRYYDVNTTKDDAAILGELNVGLSYNLSCRWIATVGYRAVGVVGVALPTNQIYPDLRGINDVEIVDSNGSLILHGGYVGLAYAF